MKRTACQREKFVELTEKQIKDTLKGLTTDEVYGLRLSEAGELELDTDGFFTTNMMKKIHTNTLVPMVEDDCLASIKGDGRDREAAKTLKQEVLHLLNGTNQ